MGKIAPDELKVISIICHKLRMSSAQLIAAKYIWAEDHHESWSHDDKKVGIRYNPNNAHDQWAVFTPGIRVSHLTMKPN